MNTESTVSCLGKSLDILEFPNKFKDLKSKALGLADDMYVYSSDLYETCENIVNSISIVSELDSVEKLASKIFNYDVEKFSLTASQLKYLQDSILAKEVSTINYYSGVHEGNMPSEEKVMMIHTYFSSLHNTLNNIIETSYCYLTMHGHYDYDDDYDEDYDDDNFYGEYDDIYDEYCKNESELSIKTHLM